MLGALALALSPCKTGPSTQELQQVEEKFVALTAAYPAVDLARGRRLYIKQCKVCHQADGLGAPNAIPPLKGHVPSLVKSPLSRAYLARLGLYGLRGEINVLNKTYMNVMPALGALMTDAEIASALAYAALAWGNNRAVDPADLPTPDDIARERQTPRRGADNLMMRRQLLKELSPR